MGPTYATGVGASEAGASQSSAFPGGSLGTREGSWSVAVVRRTPTPSIAPAQCHLLWKRKGASPPVPCSKLHVYRAAGAAPLQERCPRLAPLLLPTIIDTNTWGSLVLVLSLWRYSYSSKGRCGIRLKAGIVGNRRTRKSIVRFGTLPHRGRVGPVRARGGLAFS